MPLPLIHLPNTTLHPSAFCLGTANWREKSESAVASLYSQFRSAGGNFFDSAHCYAFWDNALGEPERILGRLVKQDNRTQILVATKGGHYGSPGYDRPPNYLSPETIRSDIRDCLDRLQLPHIDLFYLHRDDTRVHVTEIIDSLAEESAAGRIRFFAASNWSRKRLTAANAYAHRANKPGLVASQPLWNLAHFIPPDNWDHTHQVLNDDPAEINWYAQNNFPVIPFAPTVNGGFADPSHLKPQFNNPITLRRLAAAQSIARELCTTPNQIALAWLRHHPFPVIPILGTLNPTHLTDALASVNITLTPTHLAQLT